MSVRSLVKCSTCGAEISRVTWNYGKSMPITEFFCNTTCKGIWQVKSREALGFTKEWLTHQYMTLGRSANDIAKEIGRDSKRVWEWLKMYEIPTRPRGTDYGGHFKPGMIGTMLGKKHSEATKLKLREIALADGRVPWGKDNPPYWKGKKGEQHPSWAGGATPERQACYSSPEWVEAVKEVWRRDNATCRKCGVHHNETNIRGTFHIHHVISFQFKEYRTDPTNLVLLCNKCHKWVHGKLNTQKDFLSLPVAKSDFDKKQMDFLSILDEQ
jgi:hypothetical protein